MSYHNVVRFEMARRGTVVRAFSMGYLKIKSNFGLRPYFFILANHFLKYSHPILYFQFYFI